MATRAYIIPLRNDFAGMGVQVNDLRPNSSALNLIYDGPGQSGYLHSSLDSPGTTVTSGVSYVSGSLNTSPIQDAAAADTTGGGNDVIATTAATEFGLRAYIRERVQAGGLGNANAGRLTVNQAATAAVGILARVLAGQTLTLSDINAVLAAAVAQTDLTGAGTSKSFGSVEEILRILSGEVYRTPINTIICNVANQFRTLSQRETLVSNQDVANNGGLTFVAQGGFLEASDAGWRNLRVLALSSDVQGSASSGVLSVLKGALTFKNPAFDYLGTSIVLPRAKSITAANLASSGSALGVVVYDSNGNVY